MRAGARRVKPARNEFCACGSGRKFKHCCGAAGAKRPRPAAAGLGPTEAETRELARLLDAGRSAEAERYAAALLQRFPSFGHAWKLLGVAQGRQGKDALRALQIAVQLLPHDAQAHSNLGVAQRLHGDAAASAASCRRALELSPRLPEAHNNLGNALLDLGQPDAALESYGRAVQLNPSYVAALCNLGMMLRSRGQPGDAAKAFWQAQQVEPNHAPAHAGLGAALTELGRFDEALEAYRRAMQLDPTNVEIALSLAMVLRPLGNLADAEALTRRTLEVRPDLAPALAFLGDLSEDRGQFAEAAALYRRALAAAPDLPQAWIALARHRSGSDDDAEWLAAAKRLEAGTLERRQAIGLQYALGDFHDGRQAYDDAFAHYRAANELTRRAGLRYDRERHASQFARIRELYDAPWLAAASGGGDPADKPVFIVGMPRSGTTLAEQILASHPQVYGAGEAIFWLSAAASHERALGDGTEDGALRGRMAADYLRMVDRVGGGALRVVDKMPANFLALGLIHAALPNARIIHMTRDPRDTGLSIYGTDFSSAYPYSADLEDIAHYMREYQALMRHWQAVLPAGTLFEVPYEGLVADLEGWSRRMLEFIGLDWDPRCLGFHATPRIVMTQSRWQVRRPVSAGRVGRWHHYAQHLAALQSLA
jgi:tetratricopeptide (TPR) repeat protein